jgi:hypothetical protein
VTDDEEEDERPINGHYADLNYVPWYAAAPYAARIAYLEAMIAARQAEVRAWEAVYAQDADTLDALSIDSELGRLWERLHALQSRLRIERSDREPLPDYLRGGENYQNYLRSARWQRTRLRKLVSVNHQCEEPGCDEPATECHHLHYDSVGHESNDDLEALCSDHHRARHEDRFDDDDDDGRDPWRELEREENQQWERWRRGDDD